MFASIYRPPSALATVKHIKDVHDRMDRSSAASSTDCAFGVLSIDVVDCDDVLDIVLLCEIEWIGV